MSRWWMITPSAAWQMAVKLSNSMLPLWHFLATVFEPDLSVSTQWIPINECLLTWLSQVLVPRIIAKGCRSHSYLFTQQRRQTIQWLLSWLFPKAENNLDMLMSFLSYHASSSRSFTTASVVSVHDIFICCWSFRYQHCQFPCHVGVTLGDTLICSQMIKPDKMTWGASIIWSAILYPNLDSILTGNLEVPIISWNDISVCSAWSAMFFFVG